MVFGEVVHVAISEEVMRDGRPEISLGAGRATEHFDVLIVREDRQSAGRGSALMGATTAYGKDADAGIIMASEDPRALRAYWRAGHALRREAVLALLPYSNVARRLDLGASVRVAGHR